MILGLALVLCGVFFMWNFNMNKKLLSDHPDEIAIVRGVTWLVIVAGSLLLVASFVSWVWSRLS